MDTTEETCTMIDGAHLPAHDDQGDDQLVFLQQDDEKRGDEVNADQKEEAEEEEVEVKGRVCDLCNEEMEEVHKAHIAKYHGTILRWLSNVLRKERNELFCVVIQEDTINALGNFVLKSVAGLDKGPQAFQVIRRATEQMNLIMSRSISGTIVYLFGSCVSTGSWDGSGDADFTVIDERLLAANRWPPKDERSYPARFAGALRCAGFLHEELEVVARTRVPVTKRQRKIRTPPTFAQETENYQLVYTFDEEPSLRDHDELSKSLQHLCVSFEVNKENIHHIFAKFSSALTALEAYRKRLEFAGVSKEWHMHSPLPEIFSVDFDVSCRPFGVRNSWFLRQYLFQLPEARAGNAFLKQWSKKCGINNPCRGYFTSYAITILWVHFLLRTNVVSYVDPSSVPIIPTKAQRNASYIPLLSNDVAQSGNDGEEMDKAALAKSLGRLIADFFVFYNNFSWDEFVVSLRAPEVYVRREDLGWTRQNEVMDHKIRDRIWYRICVEDPYEDNLNLGRHLSPVKAQIVQAQFVRALSDVLQCQPAQLLTDRVSRAANLLHARRFRVLVEACANNMGATDVQEALYQGIDEETLATYEILYKKLLFEEEYRINMFQVSKILKLNLWGKINKRRWRYRRNGKEDAMEKKKEEKMSESEPKKMDETETKTNAGDVSIKSVTVTESINDIETHQNTEQEQSQARESHDNKELPKEGAGGADEKEPDEDNAEKVVLVEEENNIENKEEKEEPAEEEEEAEKKAEEEAEEEEDAEKVFRELYSALIDTDKKVQAAGIKGLPLTEVPAQLREAYHIVLERVLFNVEDMRTFAQCAEVVKNVLSAGPISLDDVRAAVRKEIPENTCIDEIIDTLLIKDGEFVRLAEVAQTNHQQSNVLVRKKVDKYKRVTRPRGAPLKRAENSYRAKCSWCGVNGDVWGTNDVKRDNGVYCTACWKDYDA